MENKAVRQGQAPGLGIVDPDILGSRAGADALPERLQAAEWLAGQGAG